MDWLDVIFPKKCVNCGHFGGYICPSCEVGLWEAEPVCPVCFQESSTGRTHLKCRSDRSLDGLTAWWTHQGIARQIIARVRKSGRFDLLKGLLPTSATYAPFTTLFPGANFVVLSIGKSDLAENVCHLVAKFYTLPLFNTKHKPTHVLVVDSVLLDGKKMKEICMKLKESGVKTVWCLVLAR